MNIGNESSEKTIARSKCSLLKILLQSDVIYFGRAWIAYVEHFCCPTLLELISIESARTIYCATSYDSR